MKVRRGRQSLSRTVGNGAKEEVNVSPPVSVTNSYLELDTYFANFLVN